METWKKIKGFENYMVSDEGNILSLNYNKTGSSKLLKKFKKPSGYLQTVLRNGDGKSYHFGIHRLVALNFLDGSKDLQTNHKNGIKADNRLQNLELVTASENQLHAFKNGLKVSLKGEEVKNSKLNKFQVQRMRLTREISPDLSYAKIAKMFNICEMHAYDIINRRKWAHV
jgi:hypothetical protein